MTTRPASYDQAKLLSDIQEAASSKFSEPQRSDVTALNVSKGKGKGVLKAREAENVYDESDLLCHEEQLTDVETDSDSDRSGECHLPRKQGSVVRRSTDVRISPQSHNRKDCSEKHLNAKSTATLREEERESSVAEEDQCVQSAKISCSANSKNYCYICGKPQSKLAHQDS